MHKMKDRTGWKGRKKTKKESKGKKKGRMDGMVEF